MKIFRLGLLAVGLVLSGCAEQISSDVTRFNQLTMPSEGQLTMASEGETVAIVAADKTLEKSMEFGQYAALVQQKLASYGFRAPEAGKTPDIMAELDYGLTPGPQGLRDGNRSPVSIGIGVGGGSGGYHGGGVGLGVSTGFGLGGGGEGDANFTRHLDLTMTRTADNIRVFEGRVASTGGTTDMGRVLPYLVDALFENFPGKNGETYTVKKTLKK